MTLTCTSKTNNTSILETNVQIPAFFKAAAALDTRLSDTNSSDYRSHSSALPPDNPRQGLNIREFFNRAFFSEKRSTRWQRSLPTLNDRHQQDNAQLGRGWAGDQSRSLLTESQLTTSLSTSNRTSLSTHGIDLSDSLLSPTSSPNTFTVNTSLIAGTLRADRFTVSNGVSRTVISGNGNVDFGSGWRDMLDLSNVFSTSVNFNLTNSQTGGVAFNTGTGTRIFDAINFQNGQQILFEGIDQIRFADGVLNLSVTPNDPLFSQQWNLHMMGVQNAWRFTTGSSRVMVGIQDSGLGVNQFGATHSDIDMRRTTFFSTNIADEISNPKFGHGTGVQGIIAAASNNGIGMAGINWNSQTFHIDVGQVGFNLAPPTQAMINQARSTGQRLVINMSLSASTSPEFEQLVASSQNDVLFVIASGNENANQINNPAWFANRYSNVVAVGASWGRFDSSGNGRIPGDRISYGFPPNGWGSNYGSGLTVMGPSEVISTKASRNPFNGAVTFDYYDYVNDASRRSDPKDGFNGTSAAAPNVAGVASLVWSANPFLSAGQVKQILSQTAVDLGVRGYDTVTGSGFVNADAAVRRAMAIARGWA
jgi:serine protease